jgi:hypothetical protein
VIGTQGPSRALGYDPRLAAMGKLLRAVVQLEDFEPAALRPLARLITELDLQARERRRLEQNPAT